MANGKAGRPKGLPKYGGRKKGVPNKATAEIKDMIRGALDQVGGQAYLVRCAQDEPRAFLALIAKIIPADVNTTLTGANGGPVDIRSIPASDKWLAGIAGTRQDSAP